MVLAEANKPDRKGSQAMLRRIFAIVNGTDFFAFQKRSKEEGMTMGEALASLANQYATGETKVLHRKHIDLIRQAENTLMLEETEGAHYAADNPTWQPYQSSRQPRAIRSEQAQESP
jgi:hypothetical protein